MTKPIYAAQYRLTGPTAGMRNLRPITGPQRWRLKVWLKLEDGGEKEQEILVSVPVPISALVGVYTRAIHEICEPHGSAPLRVTDGGFDAWLLPRHSAGPTPRPTRHHPQPAA